MKFKLNLKPEVNCQDRLLNLSKVLGLIGGLSF
ncbi:hypothetical protein NO976_00544 [Planktothrix agardhii]|jgi:hypothetical protein|uniref:Uncharacterized protein n=1 Tax=Planktothrix agardhii TaxID=1160 RepID=A0AAD1Q2C6_PLAAG|nr:hypothetical protein NIVACYA_00787 [Planktothrix agardhii]BBD54533.1 hypothetical protein NIES204_18270 [Planktothrix agardhii NIES-204]CAD5918678.1 hypothetical protein NO976_00544 [Planktothrix agardhii]CAD5930334.1 hypothetical protein PANO66_01305 [Planktothrix agardhii]CAD5935023.1 hypothetical protein NO2A_01997 [Planktothrix agardhii]